MPGSEQLSATRWRCSGVRCSITGRALAKAAMYRKSTASQEITQEEKEQGRHYRMTALTAESTQLKFHVFASSRDCPSESKENNNETVM